MRLNLKFREQINSVGSWLTTEFDQIMAAIRGAWLTEHTEDDGHSNITAYSITLTKDAAATNPTKTGNVTAGGDVVAGGVGTFGGNVTANSGAIANIAASFESKLSGAEGNASVLGPSLNLGRNTVNYAWEIIANTLKGATPGSQGSLEFVRATESSVYRRAMRLTQADTPAAGEYYLVPSVPGKLFLGTIASIIGDAGRITKIWATDTDSTNVITNGVTFPAVQVASAGANTLDDYEEGSFTPTLSSDGGGSATYTASGGNYIKIGRFCFFSGRIIINIHSFLAGNMFIVGMPFNVHASQYGGGTCAYYTTLNVVTQSVNFYLIPGVNYGIMTLGQNAGGVATMQAADLVNGSDLLFSGWYMTDN